MARQNSAITVIGGIGNMRGFKFPTLSGTYAGLKGGASKDVILSAPEFVRTRENMSEFGVSSESNRIQRISLGLLWSGFRTPYRAGRFQQINVSIIRQQPGVRGERPLDFNGFEPLFEGFQMNQNLNFGSIYTQPVTATAIVGTPVSNVDFQAATPGEINAPPGATHYRLLASIGYSSNWSYLAGSGYIPDGAFGGANGTTISGYYDLLVGNPSITISPNAGVVGTTGILLVSAGIEFYQLVGSVYYRLEQGNASYIVKAAA